MVLQVWQGRGTTRSQRATGSPTDERGGPEARRTGVPHLMRHPEADGRRTQTTCQGQRERKRAGGRTVHPGNPLVGGPSGGRRVGETPAQEPGQAKWWARLGLGGDPCMSAQRSGPQKSGGGRGQGLSRDWLRGRGRGGAAASRNPGVLAPALAMIRLPDRVRRQIPNICFLLKSCPRPARGTQVV